MNAGQTQLFLDVRAKISRSAFTEFKKEHGVAKDDVEHAKHVHEKFRRLRPLDSAELRDVAVTVLCDSAGSWRHGHEPFPATLWANGARHVKGGRAFTGSLVQFAELLLKERARQVNPIGDPKRGGWVIEPTTNPTGVRENDSTLAMHAVFLDCDGNGAWDWLSYWLSQLQLCHVLYQSGGYTPATPKWRVVLPLEQPFDVGTETGRDAWKVAYNHVRVLCGALGYLGSVGFDPATETPCNPWFLTERRSPTDPERQIAWRPGRALDLAKLVGSLPAPPIETSSDVEYATTARITLTEERFEEIVDALAAATVHVPAGRRDIYLAMPAVLLNRGLAPDDVRRVVVEVSSRYPRVHKDKHEDNVHCAETTIEKWESEGAQARITQIGTLQSLAPEVAAALDEVLPNLSNKAMKEAVAEILGGHDAAAAMPVTSTPAAAPTYLPADPPPPPSRPKVKKIRARRTPLQKKLQGIAKKLTEHRLAVRQIEGGLMLIALRGDPLPAGDEGAKLLASALGFRLPQATWQEALELMGPSLMASGIAQSEERVQLLEADFNKGRSSKTKTDKKQAKRRDDDRQRRAVGAWEVR